MIPGVDGNGGEEGAVEGGGELLAAAALENVGHCAAAAHVTRHVFNYAYDWNAELDAERVLLAHVVERHALRRRHEQRAVQSQPRQALYNAAGDERGTALRLRFAYSVQT
jgi:hypothetical protein